MRGTPYFLLTGSFDYCGSHCVWHLAVLVAVALMDQACPQLTLTLTLAPALTPPRPPRRVSSSSSRTVTRTRRSPRGRATPRMTCSSRYAPSPNLPHTHPHTHTHTSCHPPATLLHPPALSCPLRPTLCSAPRPPPLPQVFENGVLTKEWTKMEVSAAASVYNKKGVAAGTVMPS